MKKLSYNMIGRIVSSMDPVIVKGIIEEYTPLATDEVYIPKAYEAVNLLFPELDDYDRLLLFIAVVYRIYIPASFLPQLNCPGRDNQALQKLPIGMRDIIARCAGLKFPEEVNRLKHSIEPNTKNARYKAKMNLVTDAIGLTYSDTI